MISIIAVRKIQTFSHPLPPKGDEETNQNDFISLVSGPRDMNPLILLPI